MSSALAIASVTHVLKDLLNNGLIDNEVSGIINSTVTVTALPPDRVEKDNNPEKNQLNLFMYMATQNVGWRNLHFPSRNAKGEQIDNPPLVLDLHYLLIAHGAIDLHSEILLGYGMQLMHEHPVLPRELIRNTLMASDEFNPGNLPPNLKSLALSGLAEQIEQIKITPELLNTEEMSRLWTAFGAKYRSNAAYKITTVLIQSEKPTQTALPVRKRNIYVLPFHQPVIYNIRSQAPPDGPIEENQKILSGYHLVINGRQLKSELVEVLTSEMALPIVSDQVSESRIVVSIPASLPAGIHPVRVIHQYKIGTPEVAHKGVASNIEAFVLCPDIIGKPAYGLSKITMNIKPAVEPNQSVELLLNKLNVPVTDDPVAYSFQMDLESPPAEPTTNITFNTPGIKPGKYLVRIRVDGAESPVKPDYITPDIDII